ncbi:mediator complex subunit MED14-domain-containing protein [Elsinoe ampelina]|uniref:Mediator of RNA polymerase II transcription subunit 14 n=1 Tax=Elsinoe ampelina TaxID=302913 RepID=A0A6A6G2P2_9PEZI|nr:mediator complex subunit MED14-domain-containing protein [Elsinoe ampelina]
MPGRLVMDVKEPQGLTGQKRDGSHLSHPSDGPEQKRIASDAFRAKLNGVSNQTESSTNTASPAPVVNGASHHGDLHQHVLQAGDSEVPELEHYGDALIPFGKIVERMAQQTYFDLSEAVEMLADMRINPQTQFTNGAGGQAALDKSQESVEKKLRLLNFAQTHKDRFIKALVLSDWARNMGDMTKLIDVSMFLRTQDGSTHAAADSLYRLKENMMGAKMPNPNIEGALELLSTGEAPWMPDMGYVPPKPLSAQELLDTLSDMDFALSVRLNLHQDLPPRFQKYTIANGRATFTVDGEFEVDLAVADDDPEASFYFIDLRLLFSPTTPINNDRLRNQLEARANETLATSGLQGCYDFLHNFVLTHKLNVLRCQALELARGKWIDNIKVEGIHRNVVVQYWRNQGGGKNWIELGVGSGQSKVGAKQPSVPEITVRWVRRGQEVPDHDLKFNFTVLSMENILDQVIAKHTSGRLSALSTALAPPAIDDTNFAQDLITSSTDATDCVLQLISNDASMAITTDPIRGFYCVQPQSKSAREIERKLNHDPLADSANVVRYNFCRSQLSHIESRARAIGLSQCGITSHRGTASFVLREAVVYVSFQRSSWGADRALTVTCDLINGPIWYLATIGGRDGSRAIERLTSLDIDEDYIGKRLDTRALLRIERAAITTSSVSSSESLASLRTRADQAQDGLASPTDSVQSTAKWPQYFDPNLLLAKGGRRESTNAVFQAAGSCNMYLPLDDNDDRGLIYQFRTTLRQGIDMKTIGMLHQGLKHDQDLQLGKKGEVQVRWRASLGSKVYEKLREKLNAISTLCSHVQALTRNHCAVLDLRLESITLCYETNLTCKVVSSNDPARPASLDFGIQSEIGIDNVIENPHQRIRKQLETLFVPSDPLIGTVTITTSKLTDLVHVLRATLPLLRCASEFEKNDPTASVTLSCRNAIDYRLAYRPPLRSTIFSIMGKTRENKLYWVVKPSNVSGLGDQHRQQLANVFNSKGEGWDGAKTRAISTPKGIADCLQRLDDLIRGMNDSTLPSGGQATTKPNMQAQRSAGQNQQAQRAQQQQAQQHGGRGNGHKVAQKGRGQEVVVLD